MSDSSRVLGREFELLAHEILRHAPHSGIFFSDVPGLRFIRRDDPARQENVLFPPCVCITAQGQKHASIGSEPYEYGCGQFLLSCVEMPGSLRVNVEEGKPYLALVMELDIPLLFQLFEEMDRSEDGACTPPDREESLPVVSDESGADVSGAQSGLSRSARTGEVTPDMLDAFLRLARIVDDREKVRFLAPLIQREVHYYLVSGPQGGYLRSFYAMTSQSGQIARAVAYMREHCNERLRIESLARMVNMAESTFNRNFKKVTSLSPLQYHKHLKLYEARRLMLSENMSASSACFTVGYESQQQFTREYKRLFGDPPMKDVRRNS